MVDSHLQCDVCEGDQLGELRLSALPSAVLEDLGEVHSHLLELGPLEVGDGDRPVVVGGSECDRTVLEADLPLLVEGCGQDVHDLLVELGDDLGELLDHHLRGELLLDDGPVDLVDEQHGPDPLFECLPDNCLGLGHDSLDCAAQDVNSIQCPHCPGDVSTEVDVSGGVDEVDEVVVQLVGSGLLVGNDHCRGCSVDCDSPCCLLLIVIEQALLTGGLGGHHSGSCDQVVGECCLSVVDMCCSSEVPDEFLVFHQLDCFLRVVLSASHVHTPFLQDHLADWATLSTSSFLATE